MKKYTFAFSVLAAASAYADGDVTRTGSLRVDAGAERTSTVHIGCSSTNNDGALVVEITVPDAYTRKDFGYDDFEGPDAPAGKLSHVEWIDAAKTTSITTSAAGSYVPEPPDAFQFEIAERSRRRSAPATLLAGADGTPANLVWTQASHDTSKRTLVATFAFDGADSARVRDAVKACLPQ